MVIFKTITVAFKFQCFLNSFLSDDRRFQTFPDTAVSTAECKCFWFKNQKNLSKVNIGPFIVFSVTKNKYNAIPKCG